MKFEIAAKRLAKCGQLFLVSLVLKMVEAYSFAATTLDDRQLKHFQGLGEHDEQRH